MRRKKIILVLGYHIGLGLHKSFLTPTFSNTDEYKKTLEQQSKKEQKEQEIMMKLTCQILPYEDRTYTNKELEKHQFDHFINGKDFKKRKKKW